MIKYWIGIDSKGHLSCQAMKTDWEGVHIRNNACEQGNPLNKKRGFV